MLGVFHACFSFLCHVMLLLLQPIHAESVFEFDKGVCAKERPKSEKERERERRFTSDRLSHAGMRACSSCVTIATAPH